MKVIPIVRRTVDGKTYELSNGGDCEKCAAQCDKPLCYSLAHECVNQEGMHWVVRLDERERFEAAAYKLYQEKKAAGKLASQADQEGDGSPEALFWKQPDGSYGVLMMNAAWWGWQAARGLV